MRLVLRPVKEYRVGVGKTPEERILEIDAMNKLVRIAALCALAGSFLILAVCCQSDDSGKNLAGTVAGGTTQIKAADLTDANEKVILANAKGPVVIDFYATWCGPCKMISPHIDALAKLYKGKVTVVRCDIDQNPNLVARYGITMVPTVIIQTPDGKWNPYVGYRSLADLQKLVDAVLKP